MHIPLSATAVPDGRSGVESAWLPPATQPVVLLAGTFSTDVVIDLRNDTVPQPERMFNVSPLVEALHSQSFLLTQTTTTTTTLSP